MCRVEHSWSEVRDALISMRRVEHSWSEVRDAQWESIAEIRDGAGAVRELLEKTCVGGNIALLDRNSLVAMDWRKVFAHKHSQHSETAWVLCNEHGNVINEPDQGCPEAGFSTESFLNDLDAQFYQFPPRPGVDGDGDGDGGDVDVVDHDLDLSRAKLVSTGVIGTVRTRDGSNDNNIPAHKVIFIHDVGCGEHLLIKHDEVEHELKILEEADDPVPLSMRASRLLRGSKASTVEGTLVGALKITFAGETLEDHYDLEVFTGVVLKDRTMSMGAKVFAAVACSPQRPKEEFYLAAIMRAKKGMQYHMNAVVYCAEDKATVQVGLSHVEQLKADSMDIGDIVSALPRHRLRDFKSIKQASLRAHKEREQADIRKEREVKAAEREAKERAEAEAEAQRAALEAEQMKKEQADKKKKEQADRKRKRKPGCGEVDGGKVDGRNVDGDGSDGDGGKVDGNRGKVDGDDGNPTLAALVKKLMADNAELVRKVETLSNALAGQAEQAEAEQVDEHKPVPEVAHERRESYGRITLHPQRRSSPAGAFASSDNSAVRMEYAMLLAKNQEDERATRERLTALRFALG